MPGRDGTIFETGIERLAKQHRELLQSAKQLQRTLQTGTSSDSLRKAASELTVRMRASFLDQDLIMEGAGYPGLRDHRLTHAMFTEGLLQMERSGGFRRAEQFAQIVHYELGWIVAHLRGEDADFLQWLRRHESSADTPASVPSNSREAQEML